MFCITDIQRETHGFCIYLQNNADAQTSQKICDMNHFCNEWVMGIDVQKSHTNFSYLTNLGEASGCESFLWFKKKKNNREGVVRVVMKY